MTIAHRHELSEKQCQRVVGDYREALPAWSERDVLVDAHEVLEQWEVLVEQFALAAEQATHAAVRVGALKGQMTALREKIALMKTLRLLPRDLGLLRDAEDVRQLGRLASEVFDEHDIGDEVMDALLAALARTSVIKNHEAAFARH